MAKVKRNSEREERMVMEIVVDAYDSVERAMGWYYYLERTLAVPLAQLKPVPKTDEETKEAVADWHYWLTQGYEF